jgi:transcriptional regulator with XRE-family HTH domain
MPSNDLNARWGRRLTEAREALDLSIRELARRTDLHTSHLARFERGEAGLGDDARIRVAAEIGQQVHDLFPYPHITPETECPSAGAAPAAGSSPIPVTAAAPRSTAPSAEAPGDSGREGSRSNE